MDKYPFEFEKDIATQAILYLIENDSSHPPTIPRISSLLYCADQQQLERYGTFIFGELYVAGMHTPIPSNVALLFELAEKGKNPTFQIQINSSEERSTDKLLIIRNGVEPNYRYLSPANIIALQWAIDNMASMSVTDFEKMIQSDFAYSQTSQGQVISLENLTCRMEDGDLILQDIYDPVL